MARLVSALASLAFLIGDAAANDSFTFGLQKKYLESGETKHLGQSQPSNYTDSIATDNQINFLYTVNVSIGTPS